MKSPAVPHRSRALARGFGIAFAVLLGLAVVAALFIRSRLTPEKLRAEVISFTRTATGIEPQLQGASLTFVPFGARLEGFALPNTASDDPPLLVFDDARVRVSLLPLLTRALVIDEIQLVNPRVYLRKKGDAFDLPGTLGKSAPRSNSSSPSAGTAAPSLPRGLARFAIRAYEIENGAVAIISEDAKSDVRLDGLTLHGTLDTSNRGARISTNGELELQGLSLAALALYEETLRTLKPTLRYRLVAVPAEGRLEIEHATLDAKPLEIAGKGSLVGMPRNPVLTFAVEPQSYELAELLPLVPSALIPEGRKPSGAGRVTLGGTVTAAFADTTRPASIEGDVALADVSLGVAGFAASFEGVSGGIEVRGERLEFQKVAGRLAGEPFQVDGVLDHLSKPSDASYDLRLRVKASLDALAKAGFAPPGGTLTGLVDADITARGAGNDPSRTDLAGTLLANNVTIRLPNLRLPIENGLARVTFRGDTALVERLSGRIGRSSFDAKGTVRSPLVKPVAHLSGTAAILDLNELFPPQAASAADSARPASASVPFVSEAFAAGSAAPFPLVPEIPPFEMTLELAVDSLFTGKNVFTGSKFIAKTKDSRARVDGTFANALLGEVVMKDLVAGVDIVNGRLEGTFSAPSASVPRVPLTNVKGVFRLAEADRILHVAEVTAKLWSGTVSGDATVDLTDVLDPAFRIESKATQVQASDFVNSLTPAKNLLTGTMDLASVISGKGSVAEAIAKTLSGEGDLVARSGKLQMGPALAAIWGALGIEARDAIDFKDLVTKFQLDRGRILTKDLVVRANDADWKAGGAVTFDGSLDYDVQVELSEALSEVARKRVGRDLAAILGGSTGRLAFDLKLTGNARSPKVQVNTSRLAERARENAKDAIKKELESGAKDLLGRIVGTGAPRDSADSSRATKRDSTATQVEDLLKGLFKRK